MACPTQPEPIKSPQQLGDDDSDGSNTCRKLDAIPASQQEMQTAGWWRKSVPANR
jgi:hypothetical protein